MAKEEIVEQESYEIDRSTWPDGPWSAEPQWKVEWRDQATGYPCLAVRNPLGAWCGYVGIAEGHPSFGQHYDATDVNVHGGLTYSGACSGKICHVPAPGESDNVWWLGFDTAHCDDVVPGLEAIHRDCRAMGAVRSHPSYVTYKTLEYVQGECKSLAAQLMAMEDQS